MARNRPSGDQEGPLVVKTFNRSGTSTRLPEVVSMSMILDSSDCAAILSPDGDQTRSLNVSPFKGNVRSGVLPTGFQISISWEASAIRFPSGDQQIAICGFCQ